MSGSKRLEREATVTVRNIGGIDETDVELQPGVNVLSGRNATNRTSFLQAVMAGLGSDRVSMKGDADEADVELQLPDGVYTRRFVRQNGSLTASGDPYLNDPELADLFAFLLESNESRRRVTTDGDLRELIMRPVDLEAIKTQISELEDEKSELDEQIEAIEKQKGNLPELETERSRLQNEIEQVREELEAKEEEIEAADADVQAQREEQEVLEERLEELRNTRTELEDIRYEIETERESIESLKQDQTTIENELKALSDAPRSGYDDLEAEIEQLRQRRRRLDQEISSLQNTIQFNENMLDGERTDVSKSLKDDDRDVTDDLLSEEMVVCWTCGSEVAQDQVKQTLEQLRSLRAEKLETKRELSDELEDLKADKEVLEQQQQRREELDQQQSRIERELERAEDHLEELHEQREQAHQQVEELEAEVEALESGQFDEILELHREANQQEYELGRLENDLEAVASEIASIEAQLEKRSELEAEREGITEELTDLRTRVEQLEVAAIEAFNEHMDTILEMLEYDNLDRIWIERVQREIQEGRRKTIKTLFELHVVRSTSSGTTYEDAIDHLSESEREVTGLVFALAGYLVHDVHEKVPFMVLDSLEAIDSERIADLVDHFSDFPEYLVVALLPEDSQALDETYTRITSI
ncbi:archaea-specific SMC-related protein [Halorhabdus salina]|uniref:archaea-specific SMC-related protein n=1 Tax=Halorhabdus salina TaxID=2750670 RepID=UPI0015EF2DBB|nr:archaea-specific SMC-related protein [Halorhabdus salina]